MSYGIEPKRSSQTQIIKDYLRKSRCYNNKRTKHTPEQWTVILKNLVKGKGYVTVRDLKQYSTVDKDTPITLAHRLVKKGLLFPGKFKPQRYYLTAEEAAQAIAEKPPRKQTDFSKIKCKVMQAPPIRRGPDGQSLQITHENDLSNPLSECINITFDANAATIPLTAAELASGKSPIRYQNYGRVGALVKDAYGSGLYDALDTMRNIPLTVHNLSFAFDIPPCDVDSKGRVSLLDGTSITYQIFASGCASVQAELTTSPLLPSALGQFMERIQTRLPFDSPQVETWDITLSDPAFDIPVERGQRWIRQFKLPEFQHNGQRYHLYGRKIGGKMHLRVEYHATPHVNLIGYPQFVEQARTMLLEVCGKDSFFETGNNHVSAEAA